MSKIDITSSFLYRRRYWIGHLLIAVVLISLITLAAFLIPSGLTEQAHESIITSSQLGLSTIWHTAPLDAPFYMTQHAMLSIFGVSLVGIKLLSIILGVITAFCMLLLLRQWFSHGIAVLATLLAITTGQFLFLTQQGTISVLYLFWPVVLLLLATLVAKRVRFHGFWKILFFLSAALSLYTPLSIYVLISLGSAILLHPHLRYIVRKLPRGRMAIGAGAGLVVLLPLIITGIKNPTIFLQLLGIPSQWPESLTNNLIELANQYFGFMSLGSQSVMLPVFGFGSMAIILYGLYRSIRTHETVQSYVILAWIVLLFPVLVINTAFTSIMFVPMLLLLATGLERILSSWYKIFPFNPYARVAGLIPLVVLVGGLILFGLERYGYGYRYAPTIVQNFSHDVLIIPDVPVLVVADKEQPLYEAVASYGRNFTVQTQPPADNSSYAVTAEAYDANAAIAPNQIITTGAFNDAARFYVYK